VDLVQGAQAFQILARHLKDTGEGGLRRDLNKAIRDAAQPAADTVRNLSHLMEYMPNRYAGVLYDSLKVTTTATTGTHPGIRINARAQGFRYPRKLSRLDRGVLGHPVFGMRSKANPRMWAVWEDQTAGVQERFFEDPLERAAPQVRDAVLEAMRNTCEQITRRT
jgi:hypothetical protein